MTPEEMRICIAEACGFSDVKIRFWDGDERDPVLHGRLNGVAGFIPVADYVRDLNAIHEVEKTLTKQQHWEYISELIALTGAESTEEYAECFVLAHATAAQRAEAFCRTLWPERFRESSPAY